MKLSDVYPKDLILERVASDNIFFYELNLDNIDEIVKKKESSMFELGGVIWDKYIQVTSGVDPMSLAQYFQNGDPYLFREASKIIGHETIENIVYNYAEITDMGVGVNNLKFSELLIAIIHPKILHISDVEFSNPHEPILEEDRKYTFQNFKGLGAFELLITNCIEFSKQEYINRICLTAANIDLVPLFEKYGFTVDDTPTGRHGMSQGSSIPMTKIV